MESREPQSPPPYYPNVRSYSPPPVPPQSTAHRARQWWIAIPLIVLLVAAGIGALAFLGVRLVTGVKHGIDQAQGTTTAYFDAIRTHDWKAAHDFLDADLAGKTATADLQATWQRREQADGAIDRFTPGNTTINNTNGRVTAQVAGILHYQGGAADSKIVTLVQEDGKWKLSSLP